MASILRQIVAGPRQKHPEAGLDLCYVTDNIIATSGPSSTFPQRAYRNPTNALVKFLDYKHGTNWAIWEFRAEGTGYPDSEVYGRIRHYPWPDHHPPPFALIPNIMASMRDWLKGPDTKVGRVVVVHCKAGKGRSGTAACSYLISEEGWAVEDALFRFTTRRMRSGFGAGVSIPSQLRWIRYVDEWTKHRKLYVERQVEIVEVHVWGLRDGVKIAVEGYIDEGRTIKDFHTFHQHERFIVEGTDPTSAISPSSNNESSLPLSDSKLQSFDLQHQDTLKSVEAGGDAVVFRPSQPIILPTNDINIDLERRNKAAYGWTMVTSVAHVWFNSFFEGQGPQNNGNAASDGVFEIAWDAMDGIKGSARKGTKALDRLAVVWSVVDGTRGTPKLTQTITEPREGELVPETKAADWKSAQHSALTAIEKDLGLRSASPVSMDVSKASSLRSSGSSPQSKEEDQLVGVKTHGPDGEEHIAHDVGAAVRGVGQPAVTVLKPDLGMSKAASPVPTADVGEGGQIVGVDSGSAAGIVKSSSDDLSDKKGGEDLKTSEQHLPGQLVKEDEK
ncbi:MAG: hypothetical protein LQ343_005156 [Gyalolechia ehrenbergii]|nr:MAG: hypothetical protein LQ343_005156 [Gyalolechia ehrenbergii]